MIKLDELEVYKSAVDIANEAWHCVNRWHYFHKDTLGRQLTKAADSIALNISEGYGRYSYKENRNFCYYARGSAYETMTALKLAHDRALISTEERDAFRLKFEHFLRVLHPYIRSIGTSRAGDQ
ncbi:MAG TPA: four helix bundle protein [Chitinophagaceae bacterium]